MSAAVLSIVVLSQVATMFVCFTTARDVALLSKRRATEDFWPFATLAPGAGLPSSLLLKLRETAKTQDGLYLCAITPDGLAQTAHSLVVLGKRWKQPIIFLSLTSECKVMLEHVANEYCDSSVIELPRAIGKQMGLERNAVFYVWRNKIVEATSKINTVSQLHEQFQFYVCP